jgi:hypothetical protein
MMPPLDLIESPARRPLSPRAIMAVVAALGLAAGLFWYLQSRPPSRAETSAPTPSAFVSRTSLTDRPAGIALPAGVDFGDLVLPSRPPRILNTRDGTSRLIPGLPGSSEWNHQINQLTDRTYLVVASPPPGTVEFTAAAYLIESAQGTATHIVSGRAIAVGLDNSSVLVTESKVDGDVIQRYGLDGRAVGSAFRLPPGRLLIRETVAGYVLAADQDSWELWDRATNVVLYAFHQLISATSDVLVFKKYDGTWTFVDLRTRATEQLEPPARAGNLEGAALSLDGQHIAISGVYDGGSARVIAGLNRRLGNFEYLPAFRITGSGGATIIWNGDIVTLVAHDFRTAVLWRLGGSAYTATF